ncbi:MAG: hypothetical protein MI863_18830 [Desulfobacterales bacterium]|nr:hypothetical protein [Desulfobacterales bacterium]
MNCSKGKKLITSLVISLALLIQSPLPCIARESELRVKEAFASFALRWVAQVQDAYLYNRQSPRFEKTAGGVLASYHHLDRNSIKWDVKPADNLPGVYTGVLYYNEHLVQSRGQSESLAMAGPYSTVSIRQMVEIFLYENGTWVR